MINVTFVTNFLRFIILLLVQAIVFKHVSLGSGGVQYVNIFVYPIFILLLPVRMPQSACILVSFMLGILLDIFYDSMGVHAAASVFAAFIRTYVLSILEPKGGYNAPSVSPSKRNLGINWFLQYSSIMVALHLFFYFSVDAFTFVYLDQILLKTLLSFIFSMVFIVMYQYLLDPKE